MGFFKKKKLDIKLEAKSDYLQDQNYASSTAVSACKCDITYILVFSLILQINNLSLCSKICQLTWNTAYSCWEVVLLIFVYKPKYWTH